jgi:predicted component of type VI protein secretion system
MLRELISLVRQAVGGEFEFDLQLVLRENAVPERMLLHQSSASRARLGLSSWLGRRWSRGDATDTCCRASLLEGTKQ